jgi:Cof subfamily protein (haloacid dehalogenase superfamily)
MRLVATDLDGTLLRGDKTVSPRTAAALRHVADQGVHVALVTGRPVRWLAAVYEQLGKDLPAVCANGAVVYDPGADEILRANPLEPDLLMSICQRLREEVPEVRFAVEIADSRQMRHEQAYEIWHDATDQPVRVLTSPEELFAVPAVKLLARLGDRRHDRAVSDEFARRVAACLAGLAEATHSSDSGLVEISAVGITKAAGLAWLCERLGVQASDVVAFGDMPNDLPMLAWAGRAVAMSNAHPAVREAADEVTVSNDEDGVAAVLEEMFAKR